MCISVCEKGEGCVYVYIIYIIMYTGFIRVCVFEIWVYTKYMGGRGAAPVYLVTGLYEALIIVYIKRLETC